MHTFDKIDNKDQAKQGNEFTIREDVFLSPIEKYKLYGR